MEEEEIIRRLSEVVGDETYNGGSVEEKRERKERGGEREREIPDVQPNIGTGVKKSSAHGLRLTHSTHTTQ